MGTDIHMVVRQRTFGEWNKTDIAGYGDRNYRLFAALAGVRNGTGFAGCKTGEAVVPIAEPRGLPQEQSSRLEAQLEDGSYPADLWYDGSDYDKRQVEANERQTWIGDHSFSFLSLTEILAYDWDQPFTHSGEVEPRQYLAWKEKGSPDSWAGAISGPGIVHVSHDEMDAAIARPIPGERPVTRVEWTTPLREAVGKGWFDFVEKLKAAAGAETDDIQIVFGFDS